MITIRRLSFLFALICLPIEAKALHITSAEADLDISTSKVAYVQSEITEDSARLFIRQMNETQNIPGDRVIMIDSPGGYVDPGKKMIAIIEKEKASGTKVICVVEHRAHSMAFNLLTHCDVRLSTVESVFVFHKIALEKVFDPVTEKGERFTPRLLRKMARDLEKEDDEFRKANAAALNMALKEYDRHCELETRWQATDLFCIRYLKGFAAAQK